MSTSTPCTRRSRRPRRCPPASRSSTRGRTATRDRTPTRQCAGCGRRAPQRELVRFAARDGVLVHGRSEPGRGVYTCNRLECFERAVARRGFARVLRQAVQVDPSLARLYTEESHG